MLPERRFSACPSHADTWQTKGDCYTLSTKPIPLSRSPGRIDIIEIGERTATGFSSGAIPCRGADEHLYYVKSPRLAGARAVVAEWIVTGLGRELGLPVRDCAVVTIPPELASSRFGEKLGSGPAFGSLELAHADDLSFSLAECLQESLRANVLAFDLWVRNADRILGPAGGNPNLLVAAGQPVALIDHGNAFDPDFDTSDFIRNHAFAGTRCWWLGGSKRRTWEKSARAALTGC